MTIQVATPISGDSLNRAQGDIDRSLLGRLVSSVARHGATFLLCRGSAAKLLGELTLLIAANMVRISVLADALKTLFNAEKRGKKQGAFKELRRAIRWLSSIGMMRSCLSVLAVC